MDVEMQERNLILGEYLASRSREVELMQYYLENKDRISNKLPFQQLPKHLKRRAMSHNRFRVPSRIRRLHDLRSHSQTAGQEASRQKEYLVNNNLKGYICRKHLRRPALLSALYNLRQGVKWMDTHLWQAKRMTMHDYYGYKVALKPIDKNSRAAYCKFYRHGCVLFDASYQ